MKKKPMNKKNYGSIPHFKSSQLGPREHHITLGQELIATKKARDYRDLVIVQEKLDGSNVGVVKLDGELIPIQRHGYLCQNSPHMQHRFFCEFVKQNETRFKSVLLEGERICGEWLIQAHGTIYELQHEPFVVFDIFTPANERLTYHNFIMRVLPEKFIIPRLIHIGQSFPLKAAIEAIKISGHGASDGAEGFVYRVERLGKVDFLAKYIPPGHDVGFFLKKSLCVWNYPVIEFCK